VVDAGFDAHIDSLGTGEQGGTMIWEVVWRAEGVLWETAEVE
jgi:hypothetical protein